MLHVLGPVELPFERQHVVQTSKRQTVYQHGPVDDCVCVHVQPTVENVHAVRKTNHVVAVGSRF